MLLQVYFVFDLLLPLKYVTWNTSSQITDMLYQRALVLLWKLR